jgi:hypothetical protein
MSCRTGRKRWKGKGAMGFAEVREKRNRWAAGLLRFFSSFSCRIILGKKI